MKKILIIMSILVGVVNSYAQVNTKTFDKNKAFENYPKFKISQKKSSAIRVTPTHYAYYFSAKQILR